MQEEEEQVFSTCE